jgi:hypothetical protein
LIYIIGAGGFGREVLNIYIDLGREQKVSGLDFHIIQDQNPSIMVSMGENIERLPIVIYGRG